MPSLNSNVATIQLPNLLPIIPFGGKRDKEVIRAKCTHLTQFSFTFYIKFVLECMILLKVLCWLSKTDSRVILQSHGMWIPF